MNIPRPKIIFFAEDATLAHVGRMVTLASALDRRRYEPLIATGSRYSRFIAAAGLPLLPIGTISPEEFALDLAKGRPLFTRERLRRAVADDLKVIRSESPDLVVGDFRCSLGISAEQAGVPYIAVTNGVWSPNTTLPFPVPENPAARLLGVRLTGAILARLLPGIMRRHAAPFNEMRAALGMEPLPSLRDVYTAATRTLYADIPELAPTSSLPPGHEYIGPVQWEPAVELPSWWSELPAERPVIYVTAGSSGASRRILDIALAGLADLPVTVVVATGGATLPAGPLPANFFVAPFLPGVACARRASLVICNGGSGSIYQALAAGVPVLGIPSNADQYLCMSAVVAAGAGRVLRSGKVEPASLGAEVKAMLRSCELAVRASDLATRIAELDARRRFVDIVDGMLASRHDAAPLPVGSNVIPLPIAERGKLLPRPRHMRRPC